MEPELEHTAPHRAMIPGITESKPGNPRENTLNTARVPDRIDPILERNRPVETDEYLQRSYYRFHFFSTFSERVGYNLRISENTARLVLTRLNV